MYTVTRINSILAKAGIDPAATPVIKALHTDAERELALDIALSGEVYQKAFDDMAPCVLCDNAYNIAAVFSRFYHDNRILSEENEAKRADWLGMAALARKVIVKQLDMLAIETVSHM